MKRTSCDILDAIGNTPLVEIPRLSPNPGVRMLAKLEGFNPSGSVKDRVALYMIEKAERDRLVTPDKIILEPSTGNTGIALAMIGRRKGYRVHVVMPENVTLEVRQMLATYGAEITWTGRENGAAGAIARAKELAQDPRYYMPNQFANQANLLAHYETTGVEILADAPQVDVFVAGLGTGGTLMGVGRRLKEHNPRTRVIAVEPNPGTLVQGLTSFADGYLPPLLDHSLLDGKVIVSARDAFARCRELTEKEGIFAGISSGAVLHCAVRVAERMRSGTVVVLLADSAWKYLTVGPWTENISLLGDSLDGKVIW
ncbi:MAG: cysteine synthase family protein [Chloroflexota bacterium]|nr:MAG: cysteine synthase family protein [Chloroflexota bacterium]